MNDRNTPTVYMTTPRNRLKEWLAIVSAALAIVGILFGALACYVSATVQAATLEERERTRDIAYEVAKAETRGLASETTTSVQAERLAGIEITLRAIDVRLARIETKLDRR